ncbi:MAG: YggS family pyridoxal phosphate-dependent enzyme [Candidatus Aenigmarchaeota archaeon]|nr:YggS family pyridoxal phosphate-dependent enzyme [Candidatus Aenigmarchaeota archaeon]
MTSIEQNLKNVKERIRKSALKVNRNPDEIKLIAVTKTFPVDVISQGIKLGIKSIGETKVQEAIEKKEKLGDVAKKVEWHMIGNVQSNKAKDAAEIFDFIHSIDRMKIARKISESCLQLNKKISVLVQVNTSGITNGIKPEETVDFVNEIKKLEGIKIEGLMTIAPLVERERTRPYFRKLKELALNLGLKHLSMGMSNDFEVAIEEGATMIRIGTAIFGKR